MKKILCTLFVLFTLATYGQEKKDEKIFIKEFNWTMISPEGFERMSQEEIDHLRNRGIQVLENGTGEELVDEVTVLFWIKKGTLNSLEANYQPFDEEVDGDYDETFDDVNEISVAAIKDQFPQIQIDTVTSIEKIDRLNFRKFYMKLTYPGGVVLHNHSYSYLFGDKEFTVSISYVDEKFGQQMLNAWLKSKFRKE